MSPALLALALAASPSFLGVVVEGDDATARDLLAACPRLLVFPLPSASAAAQLAAARAGCPGTTVLLQVGGTGTADASTVLADWYTTWLPLVQGVAARQDVDGVEGPWDAPGTPAALAAFWSGFAQAVAGSGYLPVAVAGAPRSVPAAGGGTEDAFCEAARALQAQRRPWAWSYHAASPTVSTDPAVEAGGALGYRAIADACGIAAVPLHLTGVRPAARAWQAADVDWLRWLDGQLLLDAARLTVRGAGLVQAGGPGGSTLAPVASGLAAYLADPFPGDGGAPDGGDGGVPDAGGGGGTVQPSPPGGGELSPPRSQGCSSGAAGLAVLAVLALVPLLRGRRQSQGTKR